jgi:hypothetical protein
MESYYSIYELMDKNVKINLPQKYGNKEIKSLVKNVYRDVFKHNIEITTKKKKYIFREPNIIKQQDEKHIMFIYGETDKVTDEEFFKELSDASYQGKGIEEVFKEIDKTMEIIFFEILETPEIKKKRRRK